MHKLKLIHRYLTHAETRGEARLAAVRRELAHILSLDPEQALPDYVFDGVVEKFARQFAPDFALSYGASRRLHEMGVVGHAILSCGNLGEIVDIWTRFAELAGEVMRYSSSVGDGTWTLTGRPRRPIRPELLRFHEEEAAACFLPLVREAVGTTVGGVGFTFSHARPVHGDLYDQYLPEALSFGRERFAVIAGADILARPVITADADMLMLCLQHCSSIMAEATQRGPVSLRIREILLSCQGQVPSLARVSSMLGMEPRTLNRRLAREGCTYAELLQSFRRDYALALLSQGIVSSKQIAFILGFSGGAAFRRAFRGWTGRSVRAWQGRPLDAVPAIEASVPGIDVARKVPTVPQIAPASGR